MKHQKSNPKLNRSATHRKALIRNQAIHFIIHGILQTTHARVKVVRSFVEKLVTIARDGNTFNNRRHAKQILPYSEVALEKLFKEVAPRYVSRPGGYTAIRLLPHRISDTASIARLEWV